MSIPTFSFLLVHDQYQDSVSYEIQPHFTFEQVIDHICSSFNFDRDYVEVRSNLGFLIEDLDQNAEEIMDLYGAYYKIIVKDKFENESSSFDNSSNMEPSIEEDPNETTDVVHDVMDDLFLINSENWNVDEDGNIELTVIPRLGSRITQIRIKMHSDETLHDLKTELSKVLQVLEDNLLIASLDLSAQLIQNNNLSILSLVEAYGALLIAYPSSKKSDIENETGTISEEIEELIYKYKRR